MQDLQSLADGYETTIALKWSDGGPKAQEIEPASVKEAQDGEVMHGGRL
jgi:hypothetical protein